MFNSNILIYKNIKMHLKIIKSMLQYLERKYTKYIIRQKGLKIELNKQEILAKYTNDEDKILISKLFDKIEFTSRRNTIEYTDFLDMRQRQLLEKVLNDIKCTNYIASGGYKMAERTSIVIYPSKLEEIFKQDQFDYSSIFKVIRVKLPNELKGTYSHRNYLGGIIKIGIKREKIGDIITSKNGADIIVLKESVRYVLEGLKQLTRFSKAEFEELNIDELNIEEPKTELLNIIIPSMRIDSIVSEIIRTSRAKATGIIKEERVFINHELVLKGSKEVKVNDIITVRGKGRFKIGDILNNTKKGNLVVEIAKYI